MNSTEPAVLWFYIVLENQITFERNQWGGGVLRVFGLTKTALYYTLISVSLFISMFWLFVFATVFFSTVLIDLFSKSVHCSQMCLNMTAVVVFHHGSILLEYLQIHVIYKGINYYLISFVFCLYCLQCATDIHKLQMYVYKWLSTWTHGCSFKKSSQLENRSCFKHIWRTILT